LPIGLVIVWARGQLPRGSWWWKSLVLGTCAMGLLAAIGAGLAYVCWFHGLSRMTAGSTALIGLVNPSSARRSACS
jgi:drug/metabolite transporter (DMT)-like permease